MLTYLAIGLIYVLINIFVRKIDQDDPMLVILWWFAWPLFAGLWLVMGLLGAKRSKP